MTKANYESEIKLIIAQNNTEFELYPLISELLSPNTSNLSRRYVFKRYRSELGKIYYGISSFPDIAIIDKDFNNKINKDISVDNYNMLKGCVEAKNLWENLYSLEELKNLVKNGNKLEKKEKQNLGQLLGEILWYKKVLYTNGKEWRYFEFIPSDEQKKQIIELVNVIEKNNPSGKKNISWWKYQEFKKIFSDKTIDLDSIITETIISSDCLAHWNSFLKMLNKINWNAGQSKFK